MKRTILLGLLLLAGTVRAQKEVRTASAVSTDRTGYVTVGPVPYTDLYTQTSGRFLMEVEDRVLNLGAPRGDVASLEVEFELGADRFRIEMDRVGIAPGGYATPYPVGGGVMLEVPLHGDSGLGSWTTTRVLAGLVAWGTGTVTRNGQLLTNDAWISAYALVAGSHADDETHRLLPQMRPKDAEFTVVAANLPRDEVAPGFLQFTMERGTIRIDGQNIPLEPFVPTVPRQDPEDTGVRDISSLTGRVLPGIGGSGPSADMPGATPGFGAPSGVPSGIPPANTEPATPLPATPTPANAQPAEGLVAPGPPANAEPADELVPQVPPANSESAEEQLPAEPPPNAQPATPLPQQIPPANGQAATPFPATPPPLNVTPPANSGIGGN